MKTILQNYGKDIWVHLVQCTVNHSKFTNDNTTIEPDTKITDLFPPQTDQIRLGHVLFDMFKYINLLCEVELEIDYEEHSEYMHFPKMKDIWVYFIERLESLPENMESKSAVVIPFPAKSIIQN